MSENPSGSLKDILESFRNVPAEDGSPIFKFETIEGSFIARFVRRRRGIKTKTGVAICLDVDILYSTVEDGKKGPTGPQSVFESNHITQIMDSVELKPGDIFVLRFAALSKRFKRFYFKKLSESELAAITPGGGQ
jgi:hypothetical protein